MYNDCASTADSPASLAKCTVKLLNARDRLLEPTNFDRKQNEPKSQADLYEKMQLLVDEVLRRTSKTEKFGYNSDSERLVSRVKKAVKYRRPPSTPALDNLQRIQSYMTMLDKYNKQLVTLNEENTRYATSQDLTTSPETFRFISRVSLSNIQFKVQPKQNLTMMDKVMRLINEFQNTKDFGKLSILSPKLFPVVPGRKNRPHLLSPTLFSFQQDGLFSLPQLFQVGLVVFD